VGKLVTRTVFVVVAAVALWAVPSTVGAHAGNNDPQLLHVCIGNVSKVVRSVGVSGVCMAEFQMNRSRGALGR
jgi:hypothetical protein